MKKENSFEDQHKLMTSLFPFNFSNSSFSLDYIIPILFGVFIFSITGENKHYGTPTNPAASSRTPGGSSSGAAVAVAADLVDFSLGELLFLILFEIVLYFLYISS